MNSSNMGSVSRGNIRNEHIVKNDIWNNSVCDKGLPDRISVSDIDWIYERRGHLFIVERKAFGGEVGRGQGMLFNVLLKTFEWPTVLLVAWHHMKSGDDPYDGNRDLIRGEFWFEEAGAITKTVPFPMKGRFRAVVHGWFAMIDKNDHDFSHRVHKLDRV